MCIIMYCISALSAYVLPWVTVFPVRTMVLCTPIICMHVFFFLQLHVSVFFLSELHTLVVPLTILLQNIETRNHYHAIHCHLPLMVQHNLVPVFAFLLASSCWSGHVTPCAFTSALQSCTPMLHQLLTSLPLRPCLDHLGLEFSPD